MFVTVPVTFLGRLSKACGLADERLKQVFPSVPRRHECLVVEAGRQKTGHISVQGTDIGFQRGPMVLAARFETLIELGCGSPLIWLEKGSFSEVHQRVGLFRTGGHNTARAVILEAAAHEHLVSPQQRGCQSVPRKALLGSSVERKAQHFAAVNQTTALTQTKAHAGISQPGRLARIASSTSSGGRVVCAG